MKLQVIAVAACVGFSFVATLVIGKVLDLTMGLRINRDQELEGMDATLHAETAYDLANIPSGAWSPGHRQPAAAGTVALPGSGSSTALTNSGGHA
jgi:Amt family ammonium transporter